MNDLVEASARFHEEIRNGSIAVDLLREYQFVETAGNILVEAGEIDDCIRCSFQSRGVKVDGYFYNEEFNHLFLIVAVWKDETGENLSRITRGEVDEAFHRCINFFSRARAKLFQKIEIANEAHDLARLIHDEGGSITNLTVILITDSVAEKQPAVIEELDGLEIRKIIWDIGRLTDFIETGEREPLRIDFGEISPIPCLSQDGHDAAYTPYLAFVPGNCLADLYRDYGTRMLEMNVRVFLSARGNVNRGIRDTIINCPNMFCAYNNGITVFARELDFVPSNGNSGYLRGATDFQVVNGGQTVASLYHARRWQKADLSGIMVPMKLININREEDIHALVPLISEYSNTQNKVSLSDLSANQRPHPELHDLSKRIWAPDPTGGSRTTHWFYEKARGSYEEARRLAGTPAEQRKFDAMNPKGQKFDKGIFGKVWNTYLLKPYLVSLGAQKNFVYFNGWLREQDSELEHFFRRTIALLILWRDFEKVVRRQGFEGYRHNIVTYTLAWLFKLTGKGINLDRIWQEQNTPECILDVAEEMCGIVNGHIRATSQNVTEYCKKEDCWDTLIGMNYTLPDSIEPYIISPGSVNHTYNPGTRDEREAISYCSERSPDRWFNLASWLKERSYLTPKARSQCFNMGRFLSRGKEPSGALSVACRKAWQDAVMRGWSDESGGS